MTETPDYQDVEWLRVDELRCHEKILSDRIEQVQKQIEDDGFVEYPILVDQNYKVILDGHHRYTALKNLGAELIPVVPVNYTDDGLIKLEARKNCPVDSLTKQDVLRKGLSNEVFPPKSTRHTLRDPLEAQKTSLDSLT